MEANQTKPTGEAPKQLTPPKPEAKDNLYISNTAWGIVLALILLVALTSYFVKPSSIASAWRSFTAAALNPFSPKEAIKVTLEPSTVSSGTPVTVTYEHTEAKSDNTSNYYLSYSCTDELGISIAGQNSVPISCGQPYDITNYGTTSLSIVPVVRTGSASTTVEVTYVGLSASSTATRIVKGTAELSVMAAQVSQPPKTTPTTQPITRQAGPKSEKFYQIVPQSSSAPTSSNPVKTGPVDLSVAITAVGKIDPTTSRFIETKSLTGRDRIAIQFKISNDGTAPVSGWNFSASLPIDPPYTFVSEKQQELTPGDYIVYTIGFDHITKTNGNIVTVTADPDNTVGEMTKINNTASVSIDGVSF